ncbi:MAG: 4Fe-4S cluster-binding domain-containing protein [Polyangiaceae bacterium]|nr:4Fe-4S cluster-binding domain-containing protein [Polyangiaceae bacterium]
MIAPSVVSQRVPVYLASHQQGRLAAAIAAATAHLDDCTLCPRACRVNRSAGETGICGTGRHARVVSANAHFGEEAPLVGTAGSGAIFFADCSLRCSFCQNYDISRGNAGDEVSDEELARIMLALQKRGCHNVNLVTPSHVVPQILSALPRAIEGGLSVPLTYNTSGYDTVGTLRLLEGVVDIYMPDFKFWDPGVAARTCDAPDYPEVARRALVEMHRQVGDFVVDADGIAEAGLLVRHLVMPHGWAGTREIMRFVARELSPNTYVNIMVQYRPCGLAREIPELDALVSADEYASAIRAAREEGIGRLDAWGPRPLMALRSK